MQLLCFVIHATLKVLITARIIFDITYVIIKQAKPNKTHHILSNV